MDRFIDAFSGKNHSTIYTDTNGNHFRFSGGTWAWRNHNPGNVEVKRKGRFANQIGESYGFSVFPDDQSGRDALVELLKTEYANYSIDQMILSFAPPSENNTKAYARFLHQKTGVLDDTKIKNFTQDQFEKLWQAIQQKEGCKVGDVIEVFLITGVHIIGKNEYRFCLGSGDWVSESECIALAISGQVELEICHSRLGNIFLRSYPNSHFQSKLSDLLQK